MTDFDIDMLLEVSVEMLRNPLWLSLVIAVIMQMFGKTIIQLILSICTFVYERIIKDSSIDVAEGVLQYKGVLVNAASFSIGFAISSSLVNDSFTIVQAALAALIGSFLSTGGYEYVKNSFKALGYKWK